MATDPWAAFNPQAAPVQPPQGSRLRPIVPAAPKEPPTPKTSYRTLTEEEVLQRGLNPARIYQESSEGNLSDVGEKAGTKSATQLELEAKEEGAARRAATIRNIMGEVRGLYEKDIKGQPLKRAFGLTEYIDAIPTNERFRAAANNILPLIRPLVAQTAKEGDSDKEMEVFLSYIPHNDDSDLTIEQKFKQLELLIGGMVEGKPPSETLASEQREEQGAPPALSGGDGAPPPSGGGNPRPTPWDNSGAGGEAVAQGGTRTVFDRETAAALNALVQRGRPYEEAVALTTSRGYPPPPATQYAAALAWQRKNPGKPYNASNPTREEATTAVEQFAGSPVGAGLIATGDAASGFALDELIGATGGDAEAARRAMQASEAAHPTATTLGNIAGGTLLALGGEAALARGAGMAPGLGRALLADTAMGAASGAGAADEGNRIEGAGYGGLGGLLGSLTGTAAIAGSRRALTPTGGRLAPLYEEGVRPSPGQRFGNSGTMGRILNTTEEALQSVPVVGSAIRGTRERARQQFQRGAFNQALREIGVNLPDTVETGTAAHKFAQRAFNRIYEDARAGMRVLPDQQLVDDLNALGPDIQTLGPQAQARLEAITANTIKDDLAGDAYKRTISDLGKHIGRYRKSAMGEDQALADVLEGVRDALESGARRHSDREAVRLLDAADAGYAKLVRIEEASRRAGGEMGEFTPAQLDAAVKKESGGVRSKAYLRGDALMQDYAAAGRSLSDRLPNSGTADRVMAGYAIGAPVAGAATYAEPLTATILGAIGTAYAPGVRKATTGAFAPSAKNRKAIAAGLKRIERLIGSSSAAGGVMVGSGAQGTGASP